VVAVATLVLAATAVRKSVGAARTGMMARPA